MNFVHTDLGYKNRGEVIEITLASGANVRLMNNLDFIKYKNGRKYTFQGGFVQEPSIQLEIPSTGHWHIAVDMKGLASGSTRVSVRTLSKDLP